MITRRQLLKRGAAGAALIAGPGGIVGAGPAGLLSGVAVAKAMPTLRRWASACPTPTLGAPAWPVIDLRSATAKTLYARQFTVTIHPDLPPTTVWGYTDGATGARSTYLGPILVAQRGTPVDVTYNNELPAVPLFPTDPALVPAGLLDSRINTHLHGGRIAPVADGNPFHAYAADPSQEVGPGSAQTKHYDNEQGGALLWYHDHALGITRTNVYAGLAGGYLLVEPPGSAFTATNVPTAFDLSDVPDPYAPGGFIPLHIPLVIQDKTLDAGGRLVYPRLWTPEFFGDNCLVNGKAFPYLDVQRRKYRFTFLNGSQSRFYNLVFNKAVPITQIGVELGFLDSPQAVRSIVVAPGERADVIVDFSGVPAGTKLVLIDTPLPPGVVSPTRPLGDCMQFRVVGIPLTRSEFGPPVLPGWSAASPTPRPGEPVATSKVTLEEVTGRGGKPVRAVVNGTPFMRRDSAGMMMAEPTEPFTTEVVKNGDTVEWLYLNLTADSHPFHTHLAHFEVVGRQRFDAVAYAVELAAARAQAPGAVLDPKDYPDTAPFVLGPELPAPASENGPKDTVVANPGEITRIRLRFDLPADTPTPARYVYHCHILEHEENEMMRPLLVN